MSELGGEIEVRPIENRIALLILQHPQEQDKELGTARLTLRHFTNATFKVGLSWPSLSKALGREADPRRWATLYLGSADPAALAAGRAVVVLDGKGKPVAEQDSALENIEGVILLDGTWSQAKTLWWRNAWLLKSKRIVLSPRARSLYGNLRREPRKESLSTLESAAILLSRLEENPEIEVALITSFKQMLEGYRATQSDPERRRRFKAPPRPGGRRGSR